MNSSAPLHSNPDVRVIGGGLAGLTAAALVAAEIIERTPSATRQLAKRARDHVEAGRPRFAPDPDRVEALTQALLGAAFDGHLETLKTFLAEDVIHVSDGGPDHRAARAPIVGADRVARFFANLSKGERRGEVHLVRANGQLATYLTADGEPYFLVVATWVDGRVTGTCAVRNPDKLRAFHRSWLASRSS